MVAAIKSGRNWLRLRLQGHPFFTRVAVLVGGTAFAQALALLAMPVLTRLYAPADFGVMQVYVSLLAAAVTVVSLRFELALPLPKDATTAANVLALALSTTLAVSTVVGAVALPLRHVITSWTQTPALAPYLWLLPLGMVWAGTYKVLSYWAIREGEFVRLAQTRSAQGLARVVVQIVAGLFQLKPLGLLLGDLAGQGSGSGSLARLVWTRHREAVQSITLAGMRQAASRYKRFPLFGGTALLSVATLWLPPLFVAAMFGPEVTGGLALAMRVMSWPMQFVGNAVGQVYTGEASRLMRQAPAGQYPLLMRTTKRLALLGAPLFGLGLAAPFVFVPLFGPKWEQAGVFCALLTPMVFLQLVVAPISALANIAERQDLQFVADASRAALIIAVFAVARRGQWAPVPTLAAYASTMALCYVGYFALYARIAKSTTESATPS